MKNKLLVLIILAVFSLGDVYAQEPSVIWPVDLGYRTPFEYSCDIRFDFEPTSDSAILAYIRDRSDALDEYLQQYECGFPMLRVSRSQRNINTESDCFYTFDRYYNVDFYCDDVPTRFEFKEHFHVFRMVEDYALVPIEGQMITFDEGYYETDLPREMSVDSLKTYYPDLHSSCDIDSQLKIEVNVEEGEETGCSKDYIRTYTVKDCGDVLIGIITENVTLESRLNVRGHLKTEEYTDSQGLPRPFTTIVQLENAGANILYSRNKSDLRVSYRDVRTESPNRILRRYFVKPENCEEIADSITQLIKRKAENLVPFSYFCTNATIEGVNDGKLEIYRPEEDEGCADRPDYPNEWYSIVLDNTTTGDHLVFEYPEFENIYMIDSLATGHYVLNIYARCPSCDFQHVSVYNREFDIKVRKMKLDVTDGLGLFSDHAYISYNAVVSVTGPDDSYVPFEEYDKIVGLFVDEWELASGLIYSPKRQDWQLSEMQNNNMYGHGAYENIDMHYRMFNEQYGHGLQRMIVARDERYRVTYRLYKTPQRDEEHGPLFKEAYKNVYKEELMCSNDPNEIFGPAGYTNADSTIVQMINATDDINYTIKFENDPKFATSAAARVKITCPLDEHADPTTFRLGNFGFGEYTFEVPPLVSYYNNRINMDSLGYWLDVTASIQVPENEAYWIFQTIDPETGVTPIDSLGFLPVNDTLIGNGEGFVTFTVAPKPGSNRSVIQTGDTIVEQAFIIFDENEIVPTNRYKNMFDAQAPTSTIVCDTTGAAAAMRLDIGVDVADDPNGSGIRYVELYANVDMAGYEMIAQMHPDSIYPYSLADGTSFEFMCLAVDNVGNKEAYKPYYELFYCLGTPPRNMILSNNIFEENDAVGTLIGTFTTYDDQNTDNFVYTLVDGAGNDNNGLFSIVGNQLRTNYDFRCYGDYEYSIRVRTTDITNLYFEKTFTIYANQTETIDPTPVYRYLCPGESFYFAGQYIDEEGVYTDTLSSYLGCDSIVRMIVQMNPMPVTTEVSDVMCFGDDYTNNSFNLTADSLAVLTQGWAMDDDLTLYLDNYVENAHGCYDTTRLSLTVHPSFDVVDNVTVCSTDLPYVYHGRWFFNDTTYVLQYETFTGCDSTFMLHLTVDTAGTQSNNLATGWNWYSTYIDQSNGQGLLELENALGTHGIIIKSQHDFTQYYPEVQSWYGNLSGIDNKSMYMIQTDAELVTDMLGCPAPDDTITLHSGWTWIGYPVPNTMYVSQTPTAVSGYPSDGDIFKSSSMFSMYYADYGVWYGSLSLLEPGKGYMYKSNSNSDKYLYYPNHSRTEGYLVEVPETHWTEDVHSYANNITILGLVELDGQLIESDTLEVGVFCNGEKRGSGRALYLEGLDAYRIFLTVHGEEGDPLSFRLFDHNRNKERRIRCRQQLTFHANDHYGDLKQPYVIRFATDYDKLIEAEICDGQYYTENGFRVFNQGTYFKELVGQHGNDSIIRLDLTVNPVYQYEEEVVAVEFPFQYGDKTFDRAGTFTLPFQTEHGCDSVVVMKVVPYEGVRELMVSPVPAGRSDRVTLYFPFTRAEQQGLQVEVYTLTGSLLQYDTPTRFPIELKHFDVAGTYMVKVTMGTGEVVTGKIIVK